MVIGLVGGVGSGKSEVTSLIEKHFIADIIRADDVGADLMRKGEDAYQPVIELFGDNILREDGELDKNKIASEVYSDNKKMRELEQIIHPLVKKKLEIIIFNTPKEDILVFECAIMFETGCEKLCDLICGIMTDDEVRKERLGKNRGYSFQKSEDIMKKQISNEILKKNCDIIIENNGSIDDLEEKVVSELGKYCKSK